MQQCRPYYLFCLCLSLWLCSSCTSSREAGSRPPKIVVTTGILGDAVRQIVGDSMQVVSLMGPGVDPHLYKASLGDLEQLMDADLVLYQGLHLEGKMSEVLEKLGRTCRVYAVADELPIGAILYPPIGGDFPDPHIWFDVRLWKQAVERADQLLKQTFPDKQAYFEVRTKHYLQSLDSLDQWVGEQIQEIPKAHRILITSHDAFRYFGKAYGIQVKGLQGISTQAEFGLKDISDMVQRIVREDIPAIFVENSVSSKSLEAVIQGVKSRGKQVRIGATLYTDALGEPTTPEGSYTGMVRYNVEAIVKALK